MLGGRCVEYMRCVVGKSFGVLQSRVRHFVLSSSGLVTPSLEVNVFAGISHLTHRSVEFTGWADVEGTSIENSHWYCEIVANKQQVISSMMPRTRS
jgi:hypothetical protein